MKKILCAVLSALMLCGLLDSGIPARAESGEAAGQYSFYYINTDETRLLTMNYKPQEDTAEFMLQDLMSRLSDSAVQLNGIHLLPADVKISSYEIQETVLQIEFNNRYNDMSRARELLARAGVVKTFLQVPGIDAVKFLVGKKELMDTKGQPVGEMNGGTFVEFSGTDDDSYRYDTFTLYFTDQSGEKLVAEERNVRYKRSIPRERVVLEQLAKGPMVKGHYPTVPEQTTVVSVLMADGVCYAEFDNVFIDYALDISKNVAVYSVVNSLLAATGMEKVEISVDGKAEIMFGENIDLYNYFTWNEDLIAVEEDEQQEE